MKPGDVVGGRYRLTEPLASGGMGTVWLARHVELDVDVAVKVISDAMLRAPTALGRFQREARAAAQLRSPHVVQVFDYGVHEDTPYLAMERLHGEDLRTHITRVGAMPLGRVADIVDALAKALRLAHAAGIVHRDLKPANVFLHLADGEETVKILDFGIAKDLAPQGKDLHLQTSTSTVVGSPLYMSPEQVRGAAVDHRTDLWSLAVLAYEMVSGRQPFEGASLGDVFARIVADTIPPISTWVADLPPAVIAFFDRALARSPEARFDDAPALAAAFRAAIGTHGSVVPRVLAPVSRVRGDAPTLAADSAPDNLTAPRIAVRDGLAETPGADGWPTSAGARTGPRSPESTPIDRAGPPETDVGPMAERRPRRRRNAALLVVAAAVALAVGVTLAVTRSRPSPIPAASREVSGASSSPGAARPTVAPQQQAAPAETAIALAPTPSSSASSAPSAPAAAPITQAPRPRPTDATPTVTPAAKPPAGAIDPIFGVPVGTP